MKVPLSEHLRGVTGKYMTIPDVSEHQGAVLNSSFNRPAIIARAAFGAGYQDLKFLANTAAAKAMWNSGHLKGGMVLYQVYLADRSPIDHFNYLWSLIGPSVPDWLTGIMIDVETWRGQSYSISGDHSAAINALYRLHAAKMGNPDGAAAYGNQGDLSEVYPGRIAACNVVVASYGPSLNYSSVRGALGQQYTDGASRWAVPVVGGKALPRATEPFGACDHNYFPTDADGFRKMWGRPTWGELHNQPAPKPVPVPDPAPVGPVNPGPIPAPVNAPSQGDQDMQLLLTVSKKDIPANETWPGDFLLSGGLFVKVVSSDDYTSLRTAGAVVTPISYKQYKAFVNAQNK